MSSKGWECPKCGRVYSPITPMCMYCSNGSAILERVEDKNAGISGLRVKWTKEDSLSGGGSNE